MQENTKLDLLILDIASLCGLLTLVRTESEDSYIEMLQPNVATIANKL